jgi:MFS family permease
MITIETHRNNWKKWRPRVFTLLAVFLSIILLIAGTFEFIPAWIMRNPADAIHLWHIAELTAIAILLGGVMFGLVRKAEEKPLLVQFIVVSVIILAVGIAPFMLPVIGLLLLAGLLVLVYPKPRSLLSFSHKRRMSAALLAITVLFAVILDPIIQQEIHYQIIGMAENDAHALQLHWIGSALLYVMLILAGVLASTKRPGWKRLAIVTGITYIFLGGIALIVPGYAAGAWSQAGGLFAGFLGALYILIALAEAEGTSQGISTPVPESAPTSEILPETGATATPIPESTAVSSTLTTYKAEEQVERGESELVDMGRK